MRCMFFAVVICLGSAGPVFGLIGLPAVAPLHLRVGPSDLIFVGKIEEVEKESIRFKLPPDRELAFGVGRITVSEVIFGEPKAKSVRVTLSIYHFAGASIPPRKHEPSPHPFAPGKEGIFCLFWNPVQKIYMPPDQLLYTATEDPVYKEELARTRHFAKLLADPKAGLQSKDPNDRITTAVLLTYRYRFNGWSFPKKEVPIDHAESKLILGVLGADNWYPEPRDSYRMINGCEAFNLLGLTKQDGWVSGFDGYVQSHEQREAAKAWCRNNRDSYRIKRGVWE